jgi:hypothetical protein
MISDPLTGRLAGSGTATAGRVAGSDRDAAGMADEDPADSVRAPGRFDGAGAIGAAVAEGIVVGRSPLRI